MANSSARPEDAPSPADSEDAERAAQEAEALERLAHSARAEAPHAGNAMGAVVFALVALALGALGYYSLDRADPGGEPYSARLEQIVRTQAEKDFQAYDGQAAWVPEWPLRMYRHLRGEAALFALLAAVAGWLFARRERARAVLIAAAHRQALEKEIAELRRRLDAGGETRDE